MCSDHAAAAVSPHSTAISESGHRDMPVLPFKLYRNYLKLQLGPSVLHCARLTVPVPVCGLSAGAGAGRRRPGHRQPDSYCHWQPAQRTPPALRLGNCQCGRSSMGRVFLRRRCAAGLSGGVRGFRSLSVVVSRRVLPSSPMVGRVSGSSSARTLCVPCLHRRIRPQR
jgi:hypothetical protein